MSPSRGQPPVRTCVGCGLKAAQPALVRLVAEGARVVVGSGGRGGRGAWLHPAPACLDRAVRRRAFGRAFRAEGVQVDAGSLRDGLTGSARKD